MRKLATLETIHTICQFFCLQLLSWGYLFVQFCNIFIALHMYTHTHTHTRVCVCVCVLIHVVIPTTFIIQNWSTGKKNCLVLSLYSHTLLPTLLTYGNTGFFHLKHVI